VESGECIDGLMKVKVTTDDIIWGDIPDDMKEICARMLCPNTTENILCGQPILKLPGFGVANIVMILLVLIIFYYLIRKYSKRRKK